MKFDFITRKTLHTDYIDNSVPFYNIFGNFCAKADNERTRLYNRHSPRASRASRHLNISTHLHASVAWSCQINISTSRSCMLLLNIPPSRLAASIPPYDNDFSGKKNRISAARRLSFTADDYFRAVKSRIREKIKSEAYI